ARTASTARPATSRIRSRTSSGWHRKVVAARTIPTCEGSPPPISVKKTGCSRGRQPDQRRHAPGDSIAAVGIKAPIVLQGTEITTVNGSRRHPSGFELAAGDTGQVRQPVARAAGGPELAGEVVVRRGEGGPYFTTHLVAATADGRPQPGQQAVGGHPQVPQHQRQDAGSQPPPA